MKDSVLPIEDTRYNGAVFDNPLGDPVEEMECSKPRRVEISREYNDKARK